MKETEIEREKEMEREREVPAENIHKFSIDFRAWKNFVSTCSTVFLLSKK